MKANSLTRFFGMGKFFIKQNSPAILTGLGVIGGVTAAVMACRATTKLATIKANTQQNIDEINNHVEENGYSEEYTEEDHKNDIVIVKTKGALNIVKLYAPAVAIGVTAVFCILSGNHIMKKRNAALAAAYTVLDRGFNEYRNRVKERFGEEIENQIRYDIRPETVQTTIINEDGTETIVEETKDVPHVNFESIYARFFDEYCTGYSKSPMANINTINLVRAQAQNMLETRGYLFLNEVYKLFGMDQSEAGQVVGWIFKKEDGGKDGYVDFGIGSAGLTESRREAQSLFLNGIEKSILLDFNVDGVISDKAFKLKSRKGIE